MSNEKVAVEAGDLRGGFWRQVVMKHQIPSLPKSVWQISNTVIPYFLIWYLCYKSLSISYWLTLPIAIIGAGFLVRMFIIFHDCTHGSFFKSNAANATWGVITGILTFTPYYYWRAAHVAHHATSGDLDRRGTGDVWMMTVKEYAEASRRKRLTYRLYRNPFVMLVLGPLFILLITHRLVRRKNAGKLERWSVYWTNIAILGIIALATVTVGFKAYVMIQLPILAVGLSAGVWMFYVQHQFEGVYWDRHDEWGFVEASLQGSSFYRLPKILQWFTGSIGYHHIHHLSPKIPNYRLQDCHEESPVLQQVKVITVWSSLKSLRLRLWDEESGQLVGYRQFRRTQEESRRAA